MNKKFLIIGSNSFSGSNFINFLLNKKISVVGLSRSREINFRYLNYKKNKNFKFFKFIKFNINKDLGSFDKILKKYEPKYVVNFASQSMVGESWLTPEDWYNTNLVSNVRMFRILQNYKKLKKYIHVSTPEVYGSSKLIKESSLFAPTTPYSLSRSSCDQHLMLLFKNYNFPVCFTRSSNVFGIGQQLYRIIPKTIMHCLLSKKLPLHGGGLSKRSFINIKDVCDATYKIAKNGKVGESYNISTNQYISIKSLVIKICEMLNKDPKKIILKTDDRLGKDKYYQMSSKKIRSELNWKDNVSIDTGILETINWINLNIDFFKKEPLIYRHKK